MFENQGGTDRCHAGVSSDPELQHSNGAGSKGNQVGNPGPSKVSHKTQICHWSGHGGGTKGTRAYGRHCSGNRLEGNRLEQWNLA